MEKFLKWKYQWARLFDGLVGVLSLGFINTSFGLNSAKELARWRYKNVIL